MRTTDRRTLAVLGAWLGLLFGTGGLGATTALAQADISEATRLFEEGEFEAALAAFEQAEAGTDLTLEQLATLYEQRALTQFALGATDAMDADLLRLASLAPERALTRAAPPPVAEALSRVRERVPGPLVIDVEQEAGPGSVQLRARIVGDIAGLVRSVQLSARPAGGEWTAGGPALTLPVGRGGEIELWARALGPGEAVIAELGSEEAPQPVIVGEPRPSAEPEAVPGATSPRGLTAAGPEPLADEGSGDDGVVIAIAVIVGVLVAGAAAGVIAFVVNDSQTAPPSTRLGGPVAQFK